MIKSLYNDNYIIYGFVVLCGLGFLVRLMINMVYIYLVNESDKLGNTNNRLLKHMKMKFETCYKLNIGVNNVDTFVDKSLTKYKFCGILLSTWENFSGQVLYLSFLIVPISAIFGVIFEIDQKQILYTGAVGIVTGSLLIFVDKTINLSVKKQMIRLNLLDYLENFCKVRLEHQTTQPELLEQYRQEYSKVINKKTNRTRPEHEINEINRRKEARRKKEEEKRLNALKREEEQKRIEAARREEERKKMEERKMLAARRREEELRRLQEEREALALRREELRKRAEEKKRLSESKLQDKSEKEKILSTIQEELRLNKEEEEKQVIESIEEIAAELEDKDNKFKREPLHSLSPGMSAEEERLIEDVLREFFA
ncbi:MAG: hypothetical protein GX321_05760 [Clostridiales bacterium]|nr:hypothetical protein [Clostridiales bacterium]